MMNNQGDISPKLKTVPGQMSLYEEFVRLQWPPCNVVLAESFVIGNHA